MHKDKLEAQEYHLVKRLISVRESREKIIRSGNTITEKIEKEHTGKNTLHQNTSSPNDQSYHDLLFPTTVGQETRWSNSRALKSTWKPRQPKSCSDYFRDVAGCCNYPCCPTEGRWLSCTSVSLHRTDLNIFLLAQSIHKTHLQTNILWQTCTDQEVCL